MRIAVVATYTHPSRLPLKEPSIMQSAAPELIAGLCPDHVDVEIYNEKERAIPFDRHWDLVLFSYLHSHYEHAKVLSAIFRKRGMKTVAGGRHACLYPQDCLKHFDAVVVGEPESNIPELIKDCETGCTKGIYHNPSSRHLNVRPSRYDLIDYRTNKKRVPGLEASRGCNFACNFCVLTGREKYRFRPVHEVVDEIVFNVRWNENFFGLAKDKFVFLDNNLGGSPQYLKELCHALIPLRKIWGCSLSFNILRNEELVKLMAKAGCRYVYTGLESLNPESIDSMGKGQNSIGEVDRITQKAFSHGTMVSFGLLIGADGDSNEYLERLPEYLAELKHAFVTFIGIVCPYPGTPYFRTLKSEGRIISGVISRDFDGYTLCHQPAQMSPTELIEHYHRLCRHVGSVRNMLRHCISSLFSSNAQWYKTIALFSGAEMLSTTKPLLNGRRRYIAGLDPIEDWDAEQMDKLGILPQLIG